MLVRFIAHAGLYIEEDGTALMVDPWFRSSSREYPLLESLQGNSTIDFQDPPARETIENVKVDGILLSHFHAHHASRRDVLTLAQGQGVTIAHPHLGSEKNASVANAFTTLPVKILPCQDGSEFTIGIFKIRALAHTSPNHLAWFVESPTARILHLVDINGTNGAFFPEAHKEVSRFKKLNPHMLFITAGGNHFRSESEGVKEVQESKNLSPVQGARMTRFIEPKGVSLIGCYNHSVWYNNIEYMRHSSVIEHEFHWALSWLAPETRSVFMKPGHTFGLGDPSLSTSVDTYIG